MFHCRKENSKRKATTVQPTPFSWYLLQVMSGPCIFISFLCRNPAKMTIRETEMEETNMAKKIGEQTTEEEKFQRIFKRERTEIVNGYEERKLLPNAHGHFALTDAEHAPGVQAATRPVANHCTPAGRELIPYRTEPKGFRAGNTGHRAGLGWATGGAQVSALTSGPRTYPPLCCRHSCGHFLRGRRQIPLRRKNPTSGKH